MPADPFVVNVEAAVLKEGKWLMIVRSKEEAHAAGTLSMVGGTVAHADESDQTLEEALRRELREEVGVEVGPLLRYVESKKFISDAGKCVLDIVFLATYSSGEPKALDAREVETVHWMTTDEILTHPNTPPWIRQSMIKAAAMVDS